MSTDRAAPAGLRPAPASPPLVCFSHLRWDFVFQRPQHLMTRFAQTRRVVFVEEALQTSGAPALAVRRDPSGVQVIQPKVSAPPGSEEAERSLAALLADLPALLGLCAPVGWFYTPMMYRAASSISFSQIAYDCMDELSNFRFAPADIADREAELLAQADVVFTGGWGLYEAKRHAHDNIHAVPSGVDVHHFARARRHPPANRRRPVLGYFGVLDERIDLELLRRVAEERPDWRLEIVGPVVKISEADLPRAPNIHYLGQRPYEELPDRLADWDVALMPFALNAATEFISPTKTPEYLAAGRPVVSTAVKDVVRLYGPECGVIIAESADGFTQACERALALAGDAGAWRLAADRLLAEAGWDQVHARMSAALDETRELASAPPPAREAQRKPGRRIAYDWLVVGAGFAGAVLAERLAADGGQRVLVCDRRLHVGGNAYDAPDAAGILVHRYGPHIFHTNSEDVVRYLSRFTRWRPYEHRVLASVADQLLPMPINRTTLNRLYGLNLKSVEETREYLASQAVPIDRVETARDAVVAQVGRDLYERFFEGYTRKQWGLDPSELDASVTARVPARFDEDDRYFQDRFQAMPLHGYTRMFEAMLDHPCIDVELGVSYEDLKDQGLAERIVYTGPIDQFFGQRFGPLPYRSLQFRHETLQSRRHQPVGVVNFPGTDVPWTRVTEYKHLTGQVHPQTSISYEYPCAEGDPYYPVPRPENQALFRRYDELARRTPGVIFAGRLASYRYYNMDQVVGQALSIYRRLAVSRGGAERGRADAV